MADIEALFERLGLLRYACKTYLFGRHGGHVLLLTSQEDTEALRRSIVASNGIQEPIYVRDGRVAEGNRRVVALRAAPEEFRGTLVSPNACMAHPRQHTRACYSRPLE
jgi:hypothetical protein